MMVIQLLDFHLPVDLVLRTVLNGNGKISSVVESSELTGRYESRVESTSLGLLRHRSFLRLVQTNCLASEALALLENS